MTLSTMIHLVGASALAALTAWAVARRVSRWTLAPLLLGVLALGMRALTLGQSVLPLEALAVASASATLLALAVAAHHDLHGFVPRRWLTTIGVLWLVLVVGGFVLPWRGVPTALVGLVGLALAGGASVGAALLDAARASMPEAANRALAWAIAAGLLLLGSALLLAANPLFSVTGVLLVVVAQALAFVVPTTRRVLSMRGMVAAGAQALLWVALSTVALAALGTALSAVPADDPSARAAATLGLAAVLAAAYVPLRWAGTWAISRVIAPPTDVVRATRDYSAEVTRALDIPELADLAARALMQTLGARRAALLVVAETAPQSVTFVILLPNGTQAGRGRLATASPIYTQLARERTVITRYDLAHHPRLADAPADERAFLEGLNGAAYAPIVVDDALIGVLVPGPRRDDTPFTSQDLALLGALAAQTGVALRNTRLLADMRHLNTSMQALNANLEQANRQLERLDGVKTDFVTIASHELRTPLAQLRGYADILDTLNAQGMLDQDQTRALVNNIRKASERMEELIAAMLDVSQLDVDAMDLRFSRTTVESVLRMAIEPLTDAVKQRHLTLSARGLRGLPPIQADMQRLVQAFRNVLTNAIKFTPDGGRIDIHAQHLSAGQPDEAILITMADTGIGIDREHLPLIFNKFYRVTSPNLHSTGTYKFMGAGPGLGLTIAQGVVEGHGGKLWVESPGYNIETLPGSTFYVRLPVSPPESARRVLPFEGRERETQTLRAVSNG